ncbi:MAG: DUF58 domain-containing protein [Ruminococcus sp.]|nr:DUF58 domain-containing protein [Ruminococcus sp.]
MIFLYLVIAVISVIFYVQYNEVISLLLLIFVLMFPLISAVVNFILSRKISAELKIGTKSSSAGQNIPLTLTIKNESKLPASCAEVVLKIKVTSAKKPETIRINTPIFPDNRQTLTTSFSSEHFGIVSIALDKIVLYDILRLSRFRVCKSSIAYDEEPVVVLPEPIELNTALSDYSDSGLDSDIFSDTKAGDDPSEIFAIRDYADGDRMSRVHWKLTAKQDKLMVKDYSLPLCDGCLLLTDTYTDSSKAKSASLYDTVIETAVSLSTLMLNENMRHRIAFFNDSTAELCELPVYCDEDFFSSASSLLDSGVCSKSGAAAQVYAMRDEIGMRFGHVLLICTSISTGTLAALTASGLANKYTVLLCVDPDSPPPSIPETETEIVFVPVNGICPALAELVI